MHLGDARRSAQLSLQAQHVAHQRLDGTQLMPMESSKVSPGILSDPGIRELVSGAKGHVVHPSLHIQPCMFSRVLVGWLARIC